MTDPGWPPRSGRLGPERPPTPAQVAEGVEAARAEPPDPQPGEE